MSEDKYQKRKHPYLEKRKNYWYAIMEIPKELRHLFPAKKAKHKNGVPKPRSRFIQSLKTGDIHLAKRRLRKTLAIWEAKLAEARGQDDPYDAGFWNEQLRLSENSHESKKIQERIEQEAWEIGAVNVENIGQSPTTSPEAQKFVAEATGQLVKFTTYLDEWLSTTQTTRKTKDMHRSTVNRFSAEFQMVQDVSRPDVRRWVTRLMNEEELTPKTMQRILSALRGYWRYLQSIDVAGEEDEPFSKLDIGRQAKKPAPGRARLPFEPKDVLKLHAEALKRNDQDLADLIQLGMWSGCRIEELCSLKVEQVHDDFFSICDAKTEAGWRDVPIHPKLEPTLKRLVGGRDEGFVLANLTENKYGDRSNGIGKRFGRLKSDLEFDRQHVFHSIRKTVVTILENAGVPENVVADIVGHEKTTMTYGLYSGGVSLEVKRRALSLLSYKDINYQ